MCGKDTFGEGIHGLLVVRIQFAIFTIVRLIPQSRDWETNCASAPPVVRGREGLTFTFNFWGHLV